MRRHRRAHIGGSHEGGAHTRGAIEVRDFGREAFVEAHQSRFRAAVTEGKRRADVGAHACYRHDMAVVLREHGGEKLFSHEEMTEKVNMELVLYSLLIKVYDGTVTGKASVVYENRGLPMFSSDLQGDFVYLS